MLNKIKEKIKQNEEINNLLKDCSDDFIMQNLNLILSALEPGDINPGYRIKLSLDKEENVLGWSYVPDTEKTEKQFRISKISENYFIKLPSDFENMYLINLNDARWTEGRKEIVVAIKKLIDNLKNESFVANGLWIYGKSNVGKTFISIAILNYFAEMNKKVSFLNVSDLILLTQNSFNMNSNDKQHDNIIMKARTSDILVLDDLGAERPTPWFKENVLLPIIDYRFKSEKTTIFNSNITIDKYMNRLNGRSQNLDTETETNLKIINRIKSLISQEVEVK